MKQTMNHDLEIFVIVHNTDSTLPFFLKSNGMFTSNPHHAGVIMFDYRNDAENHLMDFKKRIKGMDHPVEKTVRVMQLCLKEVS